MMKAIATNRTTFMGLLGLSAGLGSGVILFLRLWMWFNILPVVAHRMQK